MPAPGIRKTWGVLRPEAFLPLGTGSRRCSAGTRWGLSGSPETGCCTGTWRSGRSPWRRCRGMRNSSHRTSGCSGTPVRWPGSTIPTFPSSSTSSTTTAAPGWCSRPPRTGFPTVRSVMSCRTTARSRRGGRPKPVSRSCPRSGRRTPWACCTATSGRATSCSARETGRCSPASAWSPRATAGRRRKRWPGRRATWPPSGSAARRSLPPRTCGRWAPPCTRRWRGGRRSTGTARRRCAPPSSAVIRICPAARARSGR